MSSKANNGQARPTGQIRPIMVKPSITQARIKVSWISKWPSYGAYLASDSIIFKTMFPSPKWILGLLFTTVVKKAAAYVMYFNKITNQITILTRLSHTKCYSLMNMRQLQILFNWARTWHRIVCWFLCFYHFLHDVIIKLFCRSKQNNFMVTSLITGKNTEINKQSYVKFWLIE